MNAVTTWPDLVGKSGEEAKTHILTESPNMDVRIVPANTPVPLNFNPERVHIFLNEEGKVARPPYAG